MNLTVSLRDALVGFSVDISHLDGHVVSYDIVHTVMRRGGVYSVYIVPKTQCVHS